MAMQRWPRAVPRRSRVSLGPAPSLVLHRSAQLQGTLDEWMAEASAHTQAHTPKAAFCVCVCGFFPPSLLAPSELEQCRQLQALPVLHLLPKTSSK